MHNLLKSVAILSILIHTFFTGNILQTKNANAFQFFNIPNISSPQQVFWMDLENIVLVKDMDVFVFNTKSKNIEKVFERNKNEFVGFNSKHGLLVCSFEHFIIDSYDEFSTSLTFLDVDRNILSKVDVFETVRPFFFVWGCCCC